ncbi:hypothetical protein [Rubrivivax rivuli]|uniref:hypothetical protein n=1 Tax=Rubrivivax rivuli TaxID=1862385 RepID=UPI001FE1B0A5|nr:hypothetical protein [Rubrivivax rivuli]
MDLKVPISIADELTDEVITSTGLLNLASGEIGRIEYEDYDIDTQGLPFESEDYEFTCGTLSNNGKDVEFRIEVNTVTGQYSVSASELLEIKVRAAALFAGVSGAALAAQASARGAAPAPEAEPTPPKRFTGKAGGKATGKAPGKGGKFH